MKFKISILFLVLAGTFVYFVFKGNYFSVNQKVVVGNEAPSSETIFNMFYKADLRDYLGNKVSIDKNDVHGQQDVIIHLWASWCGPCVNEVPELIEYSKKNPDVKFIIVSLDEYQDDIAKFMKSFPDFNSGNYTKIWDGPKTLSNFFNADRLPMSLILKKNKSEPQIVKSVVDWKNLKL